MLSYDTIRYDTMASDACWRTTDLLVLLTSKLGEQLHTTAVEVLNPVPSKEFKWERGRDFPHVYGRQRISRGGRRGGGGGGVEGKGLVVAGGSCG